MSVKHVSGLLLKRTVKYKNINFISKGVVGAMKNGPDAENVRVVVRIRPTDENETSINASAQTINVHRGDRKGSTNFAFHHVLPLNSSQLDVYNACCRSNLKDVIYGKNLSVIAYGQTGSGKTFSMLGKDWEENNSLSSSLTSLDNLKQSQSQSQSFQTSSSNVNSNDSTSGIIPRYAGELFNILDRVTELKQNEGFDFSVHCKFMQIYNEKIFDLLQDRRRERPLQLRERTFSDSLSSSSSSSNSTSKSSIYVQGLSEYRVHCIDDVLELVRKGLRNRAVRSTEMNAESSRSHTILQLFIQVECLDTTTISDEELSSEFDYKSNNSQDNGDETGEEKVPTPGLRVIRRSLVSLVDLAGSEKINTNANTFPGSNINSSNTSDTLLTSTAPTTNTIDAYALAKTASETHRETSNINSSLHVLGMCVAALADGQNKKKDRPIHVPFRNSVLTRLLQSSLSGTGRTVLLATVQSELNARDETHNTLMFASRASSIKVADVASEQVADAGLSLEEAKLQISLLRGRLEKNGKSNNENIGCADCIQLKEELAELRMQCKTLKQQLQQHITSPPSLPSSSLSSSSSNVTTIKNKKPNLTIDGASYDQEKNDKFETVLLSPNHVLNIHLRSSSEQYSRSGNIAVHSKRDDKVSGSVSLFSPGAVAANDLHNSLVISPKLQMNLDVKKIITTNNSSNNDNDDTNNIDSILLDNVDESDTQKLVREALMAELPPMQSFDLGASTSCKANERTNISSGDVQKNYKLTKNQSKDEHSSCIPESIMPISPELSRRSLSSFTSEADREHDSREAARLSASVSVDAPVVRPPSDNNTQTTSAIPVAPLATPAYIESRGVYHGNISKEIDKDVTAIEAEDSSAPCTRHKLRACVLCGRNESKNSSSTSVYLSSNPNHYLNDSMQDTICSGIANSTRGFDSPLIRSAGGWPLATGSSLVHAHQPRYEQGMTYNSNSRSKSLNMNDATIVENDINDDADSCAQPDSTSTSISTTATTGTGVNSRLTLPMTILKSNNNNSSGLRVSGGASSIIDINYNSINNDSNSNSNTLPCMEHQVNNCMLCRLKQRARTTGRDTNSISTNIQSKYSSHVHPGLTSVSGASNTMGGASSLRIGVGNDIARAHTTPAISPSAMGLGNGFDHANHSHLLPQGIGMNFNIVNTGVGIRDSYKLGSSSSQPLNLTTSNNHNINTSSSTALAHGSNSSDNNRHISTLSHVEYVEPLTSNNTAINYNTLNRHYSDMEQYNPKFQQLPQLQQQVQLQLQSKSTSDNYDTTNVVHPLSLPSRDKDPTTFIQGSSNIGSMNKTGREETATVVEASSSVSQSTVSTTNRAINTATKPLSGSVNTTSNAPSDDVVRLLMLQDFPEAAEAGLSLPEDQNNGNRDEDLNVNDSNNNKNLIASNLAMATVKDSNDNIEIPVAVTVPVVCAKKEKGKKKKKRRKIKNQTQSDMGIDIVDQEESMSSRLVPGEHDIDFRHHNSYFNHTADRPDHDLYDQNIDLEQSHSIGMGTSQSVLEEGSAECMPNLASVCVDGVEAEVDGLPMFHHSLSPSTNIKSSVHNIHNLDVLSTNDGYKDPLFIVEEKEQVERHRNSNYYGTGAGTGIVSPEVTLPPLKSGTTSTTTNINSHLKTGVRKKNKPKELMDKENTLNAGRLQKHSANTRSNKIKSRSVGIGKNGKKHARPLRPLS